MPAISLKGVSKEYRIFARPQDRVKEALSFGRKRHGQEFWALKDVDLKVEPGVTLGILGRNGAGKSTLLKIISGVLKPSSGEVEVNGRLAALLQLGAGFNAEFTGRENVLMNGLILGIDRNEMLERFDEIAAFADLGEFMDRPVKTYSSGMRARLGFAVAVNVEPEILVVDETLSVGDAVFKQMGLQKMRDLRDSGTTILFVSHSMGMIKNFCTEAVLLHKGEVVVHGDTSGALDRYQALISGVEAQRKAGEQGSGQPGGYEIDLEEDAALEGPSFKENPELEGRRASLRHGTGEARVSNVEVLDERGQPVDAVEAYSPVTLRVHLQYLEEVRGSVLGVTVRNKAGLDLFSTSTNREKNPLRKREKGERVIVDFTFKVPLQPGPYSVAASVSHQKEKNLYLDWVDVAAVFKISRPEQGNIAGLIDLPAEVEVRSPDREARPSKPA
ncbi:MAG: ABC transporter ATP-binding protein [Acidobacteria bacterium]|nr:ABC transporter ATP-binding protein [Acidobacteriota bacterium]